MNLDRRQFLALGGLGAGLASLGLAGCTSAGAGRTGKGAGAISWWDEFQPLQALEQSTFDAYAKAHPTRSVDYTLYDPSSLGSALQLAQQSNQVPDVFTNGFGVPDLVLVQNDWVAPIELTDASRRNLPAGALQKGLHVFDGKVYSFPLFSARQHSTLTYFDKSAVERAGGDPDTGPTTWDEFRRIARRMTTHGDRYGWIEGLTLVDRMRAYIVDLASGAGAQLSFTQNTADSPGVADAHTGDYVFDSEPFVDAFEFLGSLVKDKVMFPSSTSLDVRTARARWAGGAGGLFFDGPWNVGVLNSQFADFMARTGVSNMPTPDGTVSISNGPASGAFWVSAGSSGKSTADDILNGFTTPEYASGMAKAMDQPPANLAAVLDADVPSLYKKAVSLMHDTVTLSPSPIVQNPDAGAVIAEMHQIRPTLGEIVQGYLGGNVGDIKSELTSFRSRLSAERDRAIDTVNTRGLDVTLDDWRFPDARRGSDYETNGPRS